jgi:hypothetical protein
VVPTVSAETAGHSVDTARIMERELRRLPGIRGMPLLVAKDRFEARASTEAAATDEQDIDAVAREAQAALVHVATGRNNRARAAVRRVLVRAEAALESLNRETTSARKVLDACLYLVRALLDSGREGAARERVLECRRLVPDIDPDPADHPPSVLDLVDRVQAELRHAPSAELRVESIPLGCAFYLNGRHLGATPFEIGSLPPGEYRVQVECGASGGGRVHRLILGAERTVLSLDARFDETVRSRDLVGLHYPSREEEAGYRLHDAGEVARVVGADVVVLSTAVTPTTVRFDRVDLSAPDRIVASATVPVTGRRRDDRRQVVRAARALRAGRSFDFTRDPAAEVDAHVPPAVIPVPELVTSAAAVSEAPAPADPEPPTLLPPSGVDETGAGEGRAGREGAAPDRVAEGALPAEKASPPRALRRAAGLVLFGLGVAGHATSWVLWAELRKRERELAGLAPGQAGFLDQQDRFDALRWPTGALGVGSGLLTAAAIPLVLPERSEDRVPFWSLGLGLAGLVGTSAGVMLLSGPRGCVDAACTRRSATPALGAVLLGHGLPLLSVPLTHLLRRQGAPFADSRTPGGEAGRLSSPAVEDVGIRPRPGGALLSVRGRLP